MTAHNVCPCHPVAAEDDRSLFGLYWDGLAAGVCFGFSIAVLLYVAWKVGEAVYLGRFPL